MLRQLHPDVTARLRANVTITSIVQCVEELLMNSLDAGATCIAVRVNLPCFEVQVVDNGHGIAADQLDIIAQRYYTSKCHTISDLDNLGHYGYRGEALASILQVAGTLELVTRTKQSVKTYSKFYHNGKTQPYAEAKQIRPSVGTTITVRELFYNLPVRKKSVRENLELEAIVYSVQSLALIHPQVSVSLRNDVNRNNLLQTHKTNSLSGRFMHLFGSSRSANIVDIKDKSNGVFTVSGLLSKECHINKSLQFIYINKRLVLKTRIHKLVNSLMRQSLICRKRGQAERVEAAKWKVTRSPIHGSPTKLSTSKHYGVFVLNIVCPLGEYDITFEPTKTLVEFRDWDSLCLFVENTVTEFLKQENLTSISPGGGLNVPTSGASPAKCTESLSEQSLEIPEAQTNTKYPTSISTCYVSNLLQSKTVKRPVENKNDVSMNCSAIGTEVTCADNASQSERDNTRIKTDCRALPAITSNKTHHGGQCFESNGHEAVCGNSTENTLSELCPKTPHKSSDHNISSDNSEADYSNYTGPENVCLSVDMTIPSCLKEYEKLSPDLPPCLMRLDGARMTQDKSRLPSLNRCHLEIDRKQNMNNGDEKPPQNKSGKRQNFNALHKAKFRQPATTLGAFRKLTVSHHKFQTPPVKRIERNLTKFRSFSYSSHAVYKPGRIITSTLQQFRKSRKKASSAAKSAKTVIRVSASIVPSKSNNANIIDKQDDVLTANTPYQTSSGLVTLVKCREEEPLENISSSVSQTMLCDDLINVSALRTNYGLSTDIVQDKKITDHIPMLNGDRQSFSSVDTTNSILCKTSTNRSTQDMAGPPSNEHISHYSFQIHHSIVGDVQNDYYSKRPLPYKSLSHPAAKLARLMSKVSNNSEIAESWSNGSCRGESSNNMPCYSCEEQERTLENAAFTMNGESGNNSVKKKCISRVPIDGCHPCQNSELNVRPLKSSHIGCDLLCVKCHQSCEHTGSTLGIAQHAQCTNEPHNNDQCAEIINYELVHPKSLNKRVSNQRHTFLTSASFLQTPSKILNLHRKTKHDCLEDAEADVGMLDESLPVSLTEPRPPDQKQSSTSLLYHPHAFSALGHSIVQRDDSISNEVSKRAMQSFPAPCQSADFTDISRNRMNRTVIHVPHPGFTSDFQHKQRVNISNIESSSSRIDNVSDFPVIRENGTHNLDHQPTHGHTEESEVTGKTEFDKDTMVLSTVSSHNSDIYMVDYSQMSRSVPPRFTDSCQESTPSASQIFSAYKDDSLERTSYTNQIKIHKYNAKWKQYNFSSQGFSMASTRLSPILEESGEEELNHSHVNSDPYSNLVGLTCDGSLANNLSHYARKDSMALNINNIHDNTIQCNLHIAANSPENNSAMDVENLHISLGNTEMINELHGRDDCSSLTNCHPDVDTFDIPVYNITSNDSVDTYANSVLTTFNCANRQIDENDINLSSEMDIEDVTYYSKYTKTSQDDRELTTDMVQRSSCDNSYSSQQTFDNKRTSNASPINIYSTCLCTGVQAETVEVIPESPSFIVGDGTNLLSDNVSNSTAKSRMYTYLCNCQQGANYCSTIERTEVNSNLDKIPFQSSNHLNGDSIISKNNNTCNSNLKYQNNVSNYSVICSSELDSMVNSFSGNVITGEALQVHSCFDNVDQSSIKTDIPCDLIMCGDTAMVSNNTEITAETTVIHANRLKELCSVECSRLPPIFPAGRKDEQHHSQNLMGTIDCLPHAIPQPDKECQSKQMLNTGLVDNDSVLPEEDAEPVIDPSCHPNAAGDYSAHPRLIKVTNPRTGQCFFISSVTGNTVDSADGDEVQQPTFSILNPLSGSNKDQVKKKILDPVKMSVSEQCSEIGGMLENHLSSLDAEINVKWRCPAEHVDRASELVQKDTPVNVLSMIDTWQNPVFPQLPQETLSANLPVSHYRSVLQALHPCQLTKDMLTEVQVLGQIDNKFIACMMKANDSLQNSDSSILVLVDQHAAHERIRLEQLTQDAQQNTGNSVVVKKARVTPPEMITLQADEVRIMQGFKEQFDKIGIEFSRLSDRRDCVAIHSMPACFVQREASELHRGREMASMELLRSLIQEKVEDVVKSRGGMNSLPLTIHKLLCSQACHGAVKFGDPLSKEACETILRSLSKCNLPFQCAHGRPSAMPLCQVDSVLRLVNTQEERKKPRLHRLTQQLCP